MKQLHNKFIRIIFYSIKIIFVLLLMVFVGCNAHNENKCQEQNNEVIAIINNEVVTLEEIDSMLSTQIYEMRMNALDVIISRKILVEEAKKQNILLKELVRKEINMKCSKISAKDFDNYIKQSNITYIDTNNIISYLTATNQKRRQIQYIDSLKNIYPVKILLKPSFFKSIETNGFYSHDLNENNSELQVYIISNFKCPACQKVESSLKYLYKKYNNDVKFKFLYFSDYIGADALACEAAAKQNKFRQMHDLIFENASLLNNDSVYYDFAKKINLKMDYFYNEMQDKLVLKKLLENKEQLVSKEIYSTPTFIVNNKLLDGKYAIDYLEEVIIEELKSCN